MKRELNRLKKQKKEEEQSSSEKESKKEEETLRIKSKGMRKIAEVKDQFKKESRESKKSKKFLR